jgi:hypothetical protein
MQFKYEKVPNPEHPAAPWIPLPIIRVRLYHGQNIVQVNAMVDSGAQASIFHAVVAHKLGIDLKTGLRHEFFGVSGHTIESYFHTVQFQIVGSNEKLELAVAFTESPGVGALLGQSDFFQHHKITFERYKERIEIKPRKQR